MFIITEDWRLAFPQAVVGFLAMEKVANPEQNQALEQRKVELEDHLRIRFAELDPAVIEALPVMQSYQAYYRRFKKTYHVLLQRQSVIYKGKSIPSAAALVEAMFMAELQNGLLTAGHDLDSIEGTVVVAPSRGTEVYTLLRGDEQRLKPDDMMMSDAKGVISSILYGPDLRTRITPATQRVLFAVYAPQGIGEGLVYEHLRSIQENVRLVAPDACVDRLEIFTA